MFPYRAQPNADQKISRYQRAKKRTSEQVGGPEQDDPEDFSVASECAESDTGNGICSFETQTELTMKDVSSCLSENAALRERLVSLEQELAAAKNQILERKKKLETRTISKLTRDKVMESDKSVKFHTGLVSVHMFNSLLNMVLSIWQPATKTMLDAEQQLILVLMRLRLGLLAQDLACRFGISPCSVSVIFHSWLDVLAANLRRFIVWPSRKSVQAHRPAAFKDPLFDCVRGVIDCTEIFIQRPTAMTARSQTYSSYKHHNTIKLLVVISPTGAITFISKAWGGRTSDKELTLNSGLLEKVEEGDVFLVDRGFRCEEMFGALGARLLMPSMTKKRAQLPGGEVTTSRKLSSVRIHVERAIRRLKVFRVFHTVLPISFVKRPGDVNFATIDKILTICSALVNLQPPIISGDPKDNDVHE